MSPPPSQERVCGGCPVMTAWTRKARTNSRDLRLATRLGEISCRDRVRVVKARRPETARPESDVIIRTHQSQDTVRAAIASQ